MAIILAIIGLFVAAFSPIAALMLLVVFAPFGTISDFTGADPRTYWTLAIAIRLLAHLVGNKARIPARARWAWGAFALLAAIVLWTRGAGLAASEFEKARYVFQYFIVSSIAAAAIIELPRTFRDRQKIAYTFVVSIAWVSVVCLIEAFQYWRSGTHDRVVGTLGNPNYMAAFLAISATILLLLHSRGLIAARYAYSVMLMAWAACFFTYSRAGFLIAAVGFVLHRILANPKGFTWRRVAVGAAALGTIALALAVYMTAARAQYEAPALNERQANQANLSQAVSDLGRLEAALYAVKLIREKPVLGVGFATFVTRNYDENGIYLTTHDTYLQLLVGTGLAGATLFAFLIYTLARGVPKGRRMLLLPVSACIFVSAFSGDYLQSMEIFVALAVCYSAVLTTQEAQPTSLEAPSPSDG